MHGLRSHGDVMNLKNPDLDLIRSILLECGYFAFMIRQRKREVKKALRDTLTRAAWYELLPTTAK